MLEFLCVRLHWYISLAVKEFIFFLQNYLEIVIIGGRLTIVINFTVISAFQLSRRNTAALYMRLG